MSNLFAPALQRAWAGIAIAALAAPAPAQNTPARPRPHVLTGVRLSAEEGAPARTLILRDGRIEAIQSPGDALPADAWVIEAEGLIAVPGFVDAYTRTGVGGEGPVAEQDRPVDVSANVRIDMRQANRKGVQPAFRAADALTLSDDQAEAHRRQGFGVALVAPGGQLLAGRSALIALRDAAPRDLVVRGEVYQHAGFRTGRGGYPGTLMASHSQLRQFFLDADHHEVLRKRWSSGKSGPRPAWDGDLEVGAALLDGAPVVCEARTARDVERWLRLADELGLNVVAFTGGRDIWKHAALLASRNITVVLDLDWGDEADEVEQPAEDEEAAEEAAEEEEAEEEEADSDEVSYDYREPVGVRLEKRRLWEERRDCALRLHEAGVRVLFGSGDGKPKDLLKQVRALVESGYPREAALDALTGGAAEAFDVARHYGGLRAGASATFSLWNADPLSEKAQVAWSFVDGFGLEFEIKEEKAGDGEAPAEGVDLSGTWTVTSEDDDDDRPMTLTLTMAEDGTVEGTVAAISPMDGAALSAEVTGSVSGDEVELSMTFSVTSMEVVVQLSGTVNGDEMTGTTTLSLPGNEQTSDFTATRAPGGVR